MSYNSSKLQSVQSKTLVKENYSMNPYYNYKKKVKEQQQMNKTFYLPNQEFLKSDLANHSTVFYTNSFSKDSTLGKKTLEIQTFKGQKFQNIEHQANMILDIIQNQLIVEFQNMTFDFCYDSEKIDYFLYLKKYKILERNSEKFRAGQEAVKDILQTRFKMPQRVYPSFTTNTSRLPSRQRMISQTKPPTCPNSRPATRGSERIRPYSAARAQQMKGNQRKNLFDAQQVVPQNQKKRALSEVTQEVENYRKWEESIKNDMIEFCGINTDKSFFDINILKLYRDSQNQNFNQVPSYIVKRLSQFSKSKGPDQNAILELAEIINDIKKQQNQPIPKVEEKKESIFAKLTDVIKQRIDGSEKIKLQKAMKTYTYKQQKAITKQHRDKIRSMRKGNLGFDKIYQDDLNFIARQVDKIKESSKKVRKKMQEYEDQQLKEKIEYVGRRNSFYY